MTDTIATLPTPLAERSRRLNDAPFNANGQYVLYWMHHAMRGHDNPALDLALTLAAQHGKPVLVYQGLAGRHQYNSDRHHFFILQGARDVARELDARGIQYRFFLPDGERDDSPLTHLITDAAAIVMEQMPVQPFPRWQQALADSSPAAAFSVDARCIVPMTLPDKAFHRAFEFRRALSGEYTARIPAGWSYQAPKPLPSSLTPAFDGLAVGEMSDAELLKRIAALPIDHSVGPVADTPGGSSAGYARWRTFAERGLKGYHRTRNDAAAAWPRSVSRLSAYLHYGQVSPFRIATEARATGGDGAEKFLDELTIWRELAQHFCFHCSDPDSLSALPGWARKTLAEHADDPRPAEYSLATLQQAETDDTLWNLAQQSLLVHGELHNNLRMTWAKAIAQWAPGPEQALHYLLDLNHRYALDGNDPSSYGGLLWALGLFDRPFQPEQAVLGSIRGRSLKAHAKRLDMDAYRDHVRRPQGQRLRIAVIGAGVSGLSAASVLARHQHDVTVIEKSRGPGGRTATRRRDQDRFNHGAQYLTIRDPRMQRHLDSWLRDGVLERWPPEVAVIPADTATREQSHEARYRGVDGMNALCRTMAGGVRLIAGTRVLGLQRDKSGWRLDTDGDDNSLAAPFDVVLCSAPAPQAAALLTDTHAEFAARAAAVEFTPCWSLMLKTIEPEHPMAAAFVNDDTIAWMASDSNGRGERCFSIQAGSDWSLANLERSADEIARDMSAAFTRLTGLEPLDDSPRAHRWRYARAINPLQAGALFDAEAGIGVCGDWCDRGSRVESAWLSGQSLAGRVNASAVLLAPHEPTQGDLLDP